MVSVPLSTVTVSTVQVSTAQVSAVQVSVIPCVSQPQGRWDSVSSRGVSYEGPDMLSWPAPPAAPPASNQGNTLN